MRLLALGLILLAPVVANAQAVGTITNIAGGNITGDGGSALRATFNGQGVAVDISGRVYISDQAGHRVRRIGNDGIIVTIAGTGTEGFAGDGGSALEARLSQPGQLAVDASGNVYVADGGNNRIRRIGADGMITTIAGNGTLGFSGDGGPATSAAFGIDPYLGVDDSGALLVADGQNRRVRRIANGIVSTVAGSGTGCADVPLGDGGPATSARLCNPRGIVSDGAGGFYVSDSSDSRVRRVTAAGVISTVAGVGGFSGGSSADGVSAVEANIISVTGLGRDSAGNLYIGRPFGYVIQQIDTAGIIRRIAGQPVPGYSGDGGPAINAVLGVTSLAVGADGSVYFQQQGRVRRIDAARIIDRIAGSDGVYTGDGGPATMANLDTPRHTAVLPSGDLYITTNSGVRRVAPDGTISTLQGFSADEMRIDAQGLLLVGQAGKVSRRESNGTLTRIAGGLSTSAPLGDGGPALLASITAPPYMALDSIGNLYLAEGGYPYSSPPRGPRIRRIDSRGIITTVAGNNSVASPPDGALATESGLPMGGALAVDLEDRVLFVDISNHRVRRIERTGAWSTIAGTGVAGFSGDGGPATAAQLDMPIRIAVDPSGHLYIADAGNNRVRRVDAVSGVIETVAGTGAEVFGPDGIATTSATPIPRDVTIDGNRALLVTEGGIASLDGVPWAPSHGRVRRLIIGDRHPDAIAFGDVSGAGVGSQQQSAAMTLGGFEMPTYVLVAGGEYSIGCNGTFTATAGTVSPGQSLCVRHTASSQHNDFVRTQLNVGGRRASFTSRTTVGPGSIAVNPTSLDFGIQLANFASAAQTVTLDNPSTSAVTIHEITAPDGYQLSHDCATLAPGASCTMTITFRPALGGAFSGNVAVRATSGDLSVAVTGASDRSLASHYYRSILGREPEAAGVAFWNGEAARIEAHDADVVEVWFALALSFFNSAEYRAFNRDTTGYLTDLYRTFFDRLPDSAGLAYWADQIRQGLPREVVLASFMFSTEFRSRASTIFGILPVSPEMDIAIDFYRGLLGRLPDDAGLAHWVGRFRAAQCLGGAAVFYTAREVATSFIASPEYVARNRSNAEFVADLYNAFLRRGGELAGVQFWINGLDSGSITRQYAVDQFGALPEFQARSGRIAAACVR